MQRNPRRGPAGSPCATDTTRSARRGRRHRPPVPLVDVRKPKPVDLAVARLEREAGKALEALVGSAVGLDGHGRDPTTAATASAFTRGRDRVRGPPRQRHDRQHRVGARGGREGARVADPDARRVVQLAPGVGDRRRGSRPSGSCPSGGREKTAYSRGASECGVDRVDERLEVVAALPDRRLAAAADDLLGARGLVEADELARARGGSCARRARR